MTGEFTVTPIADPGATGNFEVKINDTLVHSKTTMGQGLCETAEETQLVIDAVQEAIDA